MKTKLHLIILSLVLLFIAGGQSVCLAAESWSYPTNKPETPYGSGDGSCGKRLTGKPSRQSMTFEAL